MGLVNHPGTPKLWAIDHENGHKRKNDEFLVMPLKHVLSVMGLVNHPGTPKLWAIAHKNGHKDKNDDFFVIPHQNVQTVIYKGIVNRARWLSTPEAR
jgi:hypothetical protein